MTLLLTGRMFDVWARALALGMRPLALNATYYVPPPGVARFTARPESALPTCQSRPPKITGGRAPRLRKLYRYITES